jgi:isopentenyldiphosphate isomerase
MPLSEELLDIYDSCGNAVNKTKPRSQVHRDGDWHRTVHVWIVNSKDELLLQKRSMEKESHPGLWDISSAGHIAAGQSSIDAAVREVQEELGLIIFPGELNFAFTLRNQCVVNNGGFIDNEISDVYIIKRDIIISDLHLQKSELSDVKFVHYKTLEDMLETCPEIFVPHEEEYKKLFGILEFL